MSLLAQFLPKKETKEYFLTLCVGDHLIRAAVSEITGSDVAILGHAESVIAQKRDDVEAADIAISDAEKGLPANVLVSHVIFAIPQHYLAENDEVNPEYLKRLKTLTKALDLSPQGFIEQPPAISYYLEKEEGSPPTLLLLSLEEKFLVFTPLRIGKVQQHVVVERTESLTSDFASVLPKLSTEILPSRILLYTEKHVLEPYREELLKFPWHKHSQFLHTPKIETLHADKLMTALVEAAASSFLHTMPADKSAPTAAPPPEEKEEEEISLPPVKEPEHPQAPSADTFGFTQDDAAIEPDTPAYPGLPGHGVVIPIRPHTHAPAPETEETEDEPSSGKQGLFSSLPAISFTLPHVRFAKPTLPAVPGLVHYLFIPVVLLLAGGYAVWQYPKTTVALIIYPHTQEQTTPVTFTTSGEGSQTILVREVSESLSGEKSAAVTGTNNVGERAKGEVTIYNKTSSSKTFPKGTVLVNGDLKFTLDGEVQLASASDTGEGLTFGKTATAVTASALGPESNVPAGSTFTFKDFPETSYTAKNAAAFTGGVSREVQSVSKLDQTNLETALNQELTIRAQQQLSAKLGSTERLIPNVVTTKTATKSFSKNVGEEAKDVTLSETVTATGYVYDETQLSSLATASPMSPPAGYVPTEDKTTIAIANPARQKDGTIKGDARITYYFLPALDTKVLAGQLAGKTYQEAETILQQTPAIGGFKVLPLTSLPFLSGKFPFNAENITVTITTR